MIECEQLSGRMREICEGDADLPLNGPNSINAYRVHWGLVPLAQTLPPVVNDSPPLLIRGWNFARALARWTLAGMPRRTDEEIAERLAICQGCEFLHNQHCTKCGCACVETNRLMNKLALATEHCPLQKW